MSKRKTQFRAQPKLCAYCGAPSSTRDHVSPEGIFDVLDLHMITVRACFNCNQEKKRYDEMLRDVLAVDQRTQDHPLAKAKFWGEFYRATKDHQSELARRIVWDSQDFEVITPAGLYLGQVS